MRYELNIFRALSDETRLRILKLLEEGELCICKIMEVMDMKQSRISRHLGILKNAGLVTDRRDGKWVHYSLTPKPENLCCEEMIPLLEKCLKDHEVVMKDQKQLKRLLEREKKGLWRPSSCK
jgi:ArsR family transcriptional regulator